MNLVGTKAKAVTFLWLAFCSPALQGQELKLDNTYVPEGNISHWRVYIDEAPSKLKAIKCVQYTLYPSFANPVRRVCEASDRFALEETGRGEFTLVARIEWRNGYTTSQSYALDLHSEGRKRLPPLRLGRIDSGSYCSSITLENVTRVSVQLLKWCLVSRSFEYRFNDPLILQGGDSLELTLGRDNSCFLGRSPGTPSRQVLMMEAMPLNPTGGTLSLRDPKGVETDAQRYGP